MKKIAKHILRRMYLDGFVWELIQNLTKMKKHFLWHVNRKFGGVDKAIIESYFAKQELRMLHIGCGENILGGWLNSDFLPNSEKILHLDAIGKFPFKEDAFEFIFS